MPRNDNWRESEEESLKVCELFEEQAFIIQVMKILPQSKLTGKTDTPKEANQGNISGEILELRTKAGRINPCQ